MESPPTWKKLSLMPIAGRFSTLFQISSRAASVALAGASRVCVAASAASAANSARRSSLPSAVSGSAFDPGDPARQHVGRQARLEEATQGLLAQLAAEAAAGRGASARQSMRSASDSA